MRRPSGARSTSVASSGLLTVQTPQGVWQGLADVVN